MAEHSTIVTRKGQVTIPAPVRHALGIERGDRVAFILDENGARLVPSTSVTERTAGALSGYRRQPPPTPEEERTAFERAVGEQVAASMGT